MLADFGPRLVGVVFLFAGTTKALDPLNFVRYLEAFGRLPKRFLLPPAIAFTVAQCVLGAALVLNVAASRLVPASLALIVALAAAGYWGSATGKSTDCGCYNGVLTLAPWQSLLLDAALVGLLAWSWRQGPRAQPAAFWELAVLAGVATASAALTVCSAVVFLRHGRELFELGPLKTGRRWRAAWLGGQAQELLAPGERMVVLLHPTCGTCKKMVPFLNAVHRCGGLPEIWGVAPLAESEREAFASSAGIRFPLVAIKPWSWARLARKRAPTYVLVENGEIRGKWPGRFSDQLGERYEAAIMQARAQRKRSAQSGKG